MGGNQATPNTTGSLQAGAGSISAIHNAVRSDSFTAQMAPLSRLTSFSSPSTLKGFVPASWDSSQRKVSFVST